MTLMQRGNHDRVPQLLQFLENDLKAKPILTHGGIVHLIGRDPPSAVKKFIEIVKKVDKEL